MSTIESWNEEKQATEFCVITLNSKIMLGCDSAPIVSVAVWMGLQEIETLEEMCDYINALDYNVKVVA